MDRWPSRGGGRVRFRIGRTLAVHGNPWAASGGSEWAVAGPALVVEASDPVRVDGKPRKG
jgi:hypothetical protein